MSVCRLGPRGPVARSRACRGGRARADRGPERSSAVAGMYIFKPFKKLILQKKTSDGSMD